MSKFNIGFRTLNTAKVVSVNGDVIDLGELSESSVICPDVNVAGRVIGYYDVSCSCNVDPRVFVGDWAPMVLTGAGTMVLHWAMNKPEKPDLTICFTMNDLDSGEVHEWQFTGAWVKSVQSEPGKPTRLEFGSEGRKSNG